MQEAVIYFYRKLKNSQGSYLYSDVAYLWTLIASTIYSICHVNQETTPELVTHTLHT